MLQLQADVSSARTEKEREAMRFAWSMIQMPDVGQDYMSLPGTLRC
jgi:hypothetical protein